MRPSGFAESALQNIVLGIEENNGGVNPAFQFGIDLGKFFECVAFANINSDSRTFLRFGVERQVSKLGNQRNGKIIDSVEAKILKSLERGQFTGAADAGDNH